MSNFFIEAFAKACRATSSNAQQPEHGTRQLFETYCDYLQSQVRSK